MTASGVSTGPSTAATGAKAAMKDGGRLWKGLREMSDYQRAQLQLKLAQWRAVSGDDKPRVVVVDGDEWAPHAFVRTLLAHLRELAHEQSQVDVSSDQSVVTEASKKPEASENASQRSKAFALEADEFPSLGSKTAAKTAPATLLPVKTTKRRITTTLIATDAPYAAVAVQPPPTSQSKDTASSANANAAPSSNPWAKRDLLERRMAAALPPMQSVSEPSPVKSAVATIPPPQKPPPPPAPRSTNPEVTSNPWMSPPPSMSRTERKPPSLTLVGKPKRAKRAALVTGNNQTDEATPTTSPDGKHAVLPLPLEPMEANLQAARVYGSLIVQRLVPSVCGELQFLIGLLHRPSCTATSSSSDKCLHANEFCHSDASSAFAAAAIETAEPTLVQLGLDMVQLVAKSLEDAKLCENLVSRLRVAMDTREERRVQESAKIGCELPVETTGTAFRDYALPFCEDMDSRLNYRSPTESVIYSNREKIRDAFLSQLRTFQKRQNSLQGSLDASQSNGASSASQDAQQLLNDVMHENQWWFARFFVLELVQVGSNPLGESDKDLVMKIMEDKMVVKNPDRLRKLHRRFSSQKAPDPIAGGVTTSGFTNNRSKPNNQHPSRQNAGHASNRGDTKARISPSNNNHNNNNSQHSTSAGESKASSSSSSSSSSTVRSQFLDHMRGFFSDNQAFFFHFLVSCDSYQFAQLVKHQLEAQFLTIWRAKVKADPRKDFTETVLRLKVLAKFIGFLRFSPQWHWSALATALSSNNPALDVAQREAVATLEQSQSSNSFDVLTLLEESVESGTIAKCIPWLCDYLTMLTSDVLSSSTRYFHRVVMVLAFIHRSSLLDNLGETGLYVAMQIERLFQLMSIDDLLPQAMRWHHITDKTPAWMKPTTVGELLKHEKAKSQYVDGLPFLYSKMFVEVCISELDDLRGFIQTRANPHHRKNPTASSRRATGDKTSTIRKVRPLQVMSDQQLEISTPTLNEESPKRGNNEDSTINDTKRGPSENPLRDAFFKLYPQLKQSVEFVVDMVVTNMCEHALNTYVKPNADALIDSCVEAARIHAPSFTQLILHEFQVQLDERLEDFMSTTVTTALREATEQCEVRVEAALRPLIAPSMPSQLISAATTIAQAQAKMAITNLITRSLRTEFLKRIAQRKRAIVKEAGVAAAAAASAGSVPASGGLSDTDSVARALKFSFDDSTDVHLSPLEEAMQSIKRNVVGMNGALQAASPAGSSIAVRNKRMMASFMRFQRAFREALAEAIEEIGESLGEMDVVLWSWSWRAVRLWLKAFSSLVGDAEAAASQSLTATHYNDFIKDLIKTLRVISQLSTGGGGGEPAASPWNKLCRFVMESAMSIPTSIGETQEVPDSVVDACAALLSETHALVSSESHVDECFPHTEARGEMADAVLARAFLAV